MILVEVAVGYIIGSIPTAGFLGQLAGVDLRREGSRNPGANNALQSSGPALAAIVLVVEAAKGYLAVKIGSTLTGDPGALAAGFGAVAGNVYNIWYRFQGGKGLGISLGVFVGTWPIVLVPMLSAMVIVVAITRSSGRAALTAVTVQILSSVAWWQFGWPTGGVKPGAQLLWFALGMALVLVWKHSHDVFSEPSPL